MLPCFFFVKGMLPCWDGLNAKLIEALWFVSKEKKDNNGPQESNSKPKRFSIF